jgi:hypothetical protein
LLTGSMAAPSEKSLDEGLVERLGGALGSLSELSMVSSSGMRNEWLRAESDRSFRRANGMMNRGYSVGGVVFSRLAIVICWPMLLYATLLSSPGDISVLWFAVQEGFSSEFFRVRLDVSIS